MKKLAQIFLFTTAIWLPQFAEARPVTITAEVASYRGPAAYVVVYLTGPDKKFHSTIWLASEKQKYLPHLRGWHNAALRNGMQIDGISGASVGAGRTLTINTDIADALIDAGYILHVDAAAEDIGASARDISVALNSDDKTQNLRGRHFIRSFSVKM
ncbi:MAG: DUF2271 domain-containing protein [Rhizobiales bacterium]|nr:DUF2271 domain-containing protein [Hyphomicrobiales bacterium]NRB13362.1 DUF2271 domain-containing protein [Hyphomicrobiales bacterium]